MKTIGVVGIGSIGERHAKNLINHEQAITVLTHDPKSGDTEKHLDELIAKSDAIIIASPTETHFGMIAKCNSKPLFVEKPIGGRGAPVTGNVIMVGYNLRFHSCVQVAKHWLVGGHIGKPIWANFVCGQYSDKPIYRRDGVILNWSHEIDLALYLLGPAGVIASNTRLTDGYDDMTDICLLHKMGECNSTIHLDYLTQPQIRQSIIVGTEATIIIDVLNRQAWLRGKAGIVMDQYAGRDTFDDNYKDEIAAFIDRLDGKQALGCTAEEALETLRICNAVRVQAGLF